MGKQGMLKMYDKEVLGKLPVVQHFYFGNLFQWSKGQTAEEIAAPGSASKPQSTVPMETTRAPWATNTESTGMPATSAPWAKAGPQSTTSAPWATASARPHNAMKPPLQKQAQTAAPWATPSRPQNDQVEGATTWSPVTKAPWATPGDPRIPATSPVLNTRAPWAPPTTATTAQNVPPWEDKGRREEDKEAGGVNVRTQAHLGPVRTRSPDSALAVAEKVRVNVVTGAVRVAEKGDLSGRRPSRTE